MKIKFEDLELESWIGDEYGIYAYRFNCPVCKSKQITWQGLLFEMEEMDHVFDCEKCKTEYVCIGENIKTYKGTEWEYENESKQQ